MSGEETNDDQDEDRHEVRERIDQVQRRKGATRTRNILLAVTVSAALMGVVLATGVLDDSDDGGMTLSGAGATFPFPLISKWTQAYENETSVKISYEGVGSSGGISRIEDRLVDFAGSDAPLSEDKDGLGLLHIPETIGAVVCAYNLPGVSMGLNLTGDALAGIFMADITAWNDPQIASVNPGLDLPDEPITVVRRADGSGTTFIWSSYLSKVNGTWEELYGASKTIDWPAATLGATGNGGVAGTITTTPYSVGYLELSYAVENDIDHAAVMNGEGSFVVATLDSTAAAAGAAAMSLPAGHESWYGVDILDAPGVGSYPVASFTYILVYREQGDLKRAETLVDFLWWAVHDGQDYSPPLYYVPLPQEVVELNEETIRSISFEGEQVYDG